MKQEVMVKKEIDAKFISINLPVRYGDEDIAFGICFYIEDDEE